MIIPDDLFNAAKDSVDEDLTAEDSPAPYLYNTGYARKSAWKWESDVKKYDDGVIDPQKHSVLVYIDDSLTIYVYLDKDDYIHYIYYGI